MIGDDAEIVGNEKHRRVALFGEVEDALATADLMSLIRKEPQIQEVRLSKPRLEIWLGEAAVGEIEAARKEENEALARFNAARTSVELPECESPIANGRPGT